MPILWTNQVTPADYLWQSVAWSPALNMFAAVCDRTGDLTSQSVMTSPDGVNWTLRSTALAGSTDWNRIVWAPALGLFCAVGNRWMGPNSVMTSPDGINWTGHVGPAVSRNWADVWWSRERNLFMAVAFGGGVAGDVMTSPDGVNWTSRTGTLDQQWDGVVYDPTHGYWFAVSNDGALFQFMRSIDDGVNWIQVADLGPVNWHSVIHSYAMNTHVAFGVSGAQPLYFNGVLHANPDPTNGTLWRRLVYAESIGVMLAVAESGPVQVAASSDGLDWDLYGNPAVPINHQWKDAAWAPQLGIFVVVSNGAGTGGVGMRVLNGTYYPGRRSRRHRGGELWSIIPEVANYLG